MVLFTWQLLDAISNHQRLDCLLNRLFRGRSKKTSKLRVTGLCGGKPLVTDGFPSQRAMQLSRKMFPFDDVISCPTFWESRHLSGESQLKWHKSKHFLSLCFQRCFIERYVSMNYRYNIHRVNKANRYAALHPHSPKSMINCLSLGTSRCTLLCLCLCLFFHQQWSNLASHQLN